jgi:arylsulfatase A-like enzyme
MQSFDRDLAMLKDAYRQAKVLHRTIFVLLADHGMMPLKFTMSQRDLVAAVTRAGTETAAEAYTSGVYFWVKDKSRTVAAAQNLAALNTPAIQSVYARVRTANSFAYMRVSPGARLRAAGMETANQYLLTSFNGANAPDVVVLFAEGVGCEPGGQAHWLADHGGASWQAQRIPLILSGPGIREGVVSSYPARLIDIAPTILQAMGASHAGMQGIPLADALTAPPSRTVRWQAAARKQLLPVVTALQEQSRKEVAGGV